MKIPDTATAAGLIKTGNVTAVTEVRSASARLFAGTWRPLVSVITKLLCCDYFSSSSVASRAFPACIRENKSSASACASEYDEYLLVPMLLQLRLRIIYHQQTLLVPPTT